MLHRVAHSLWQTSHFTALRHLMLQPTQIPTDDRTPLLDLPTLAWLGQNLFLPKSAHTPPDRARAVCSVDAYKNDPSRSREKFQRLTLKHLAASIKSSPIGHENQSSCYAGGRRNTVRSKKCSESTLPTKSQPQTLKGKGWFANAGPGPIVRL
jgi:hypothetical protein